MQAFNVTPDQMQQAMRDVNTDYDGNLEFNRFDPTSRSVHFTLRCVSSKEAGHRRGFSGQRMVSACWHAHRDFMRAVFAIVPEARIKSSFIDYQDSEDFEQRHRATGNRNIGSQMSPLYFNEACDCDSWLDGALEAQR